MGRLGLENLEFGGGGVGGSRVGELRGFGGPIAQHSEEAGSIANTGISQTPSSDEFCCNMWEESRGCHFGIREYFESSNAALKSILHKWPSAQVNACLHALAT